MKPPADFPKRQHFVPRMIQKRFVGPNGKLWFHNKSRPGFLGVAGVGDLFVEGHIYTTEDEDGVRTAPVESFFSKLEDLADPIIDQIVTRAHQRRLPGLTEEQRETLVAFLFYQHRRVPDFFRKVEFQTPPAEVMQRSLERFEASDGPISDEERAKFTGAAAIRRLEQNTRVGAVLNLDERLFQVFNQRGLRVALVTKSNRSFILGSFPFVRSVRDGGTDLRHPGVEIWMPVAPQVAVGLFGPSGTEDVVLIDGDWGTTMINRALAEQSSVVASGSRELIAALMRPIR